MLSFIFQLAHAFELEHGYPPNLLYLNHRHYDSLQAALPEDAEQGTLNRRLGMEIALTDEVVHPHVIWTRVVARHAAAG